MDTTGHSPYYHCIPILAVDKLLSAEAIHADKRYRIKARMNMSSRVSSLLFLRMQTTVSAEKNVFLPCLLVGRREPVINQGSNLSSEP